MCEPLFMDTNICMGHPIKMSLHLLGDTCISGTVVKVPKSLVTVQKIKPTHSWDIAGSY